MPSRPPDSTSQVGIEVVGETVDGAECVELARRLRPDVCLVDIRMPRLDGLEATRVLAGPGVAPLRGSPLTERELDVVRLLAVGRTNQEICAELFLSLSTVKIHLASTRDKLNVRNRVEIAAWAWETGHVPDRSPDA